MVTTASGLGSMLQSWLLGRGLNSWWLALMNRLPNFSVRGDCSGPILEGSTNAIHVSLWACSFCTALGCHCRAALRVWPQRATGPGNSRTLGLSGRLANRPSHTKLARAGPAGAEPGVTNYSKSWAKLMADNHLSLQTAVAHCQCSIHSSPPSVQAACGPGLEQTCPSKDLSHSA